MKHEHDEQDFEVLVDGEGEADEEGVQEDAKFEDEDACDLRESRPVECSQRVQLCYATCAVLSDAGFRICHPKYTFWSMSRVRA